MVHQSPHTTQHKSDDEKVVIPMQKREFVITVFLEEALPTKTVKQKEETAVQHHDDESYNTEKK